jgi:hypothetical protein
MYVSADGHSNSFGMAFFVLILLPVPRRTNAEKSFDKGVAA